jgi:hypothetical protein
MEITPSALRVRGRELDAEVHLISVTLDQTVMLSPGSL